MTTSLVLLTDFFRAAHRALDYATNLAAPLNARLVLLHVRRDSPLDPEMFTGELSHLSKEAVALSLSRVAQNLAVPVAAEVGHGRVAYAAADAVARHQPALVVLGRPEYTSTPDELVDTTSLDILRTAPCPMLVVPHTLPSLQVPRRVLLAVDGEPFRLGQHAAVARQLLTALGAELTVLWVAPENTPTDRTVAALDAVQQTGITLELPLVRTRSVEHASPAQGILQTAQPTAFDLVVVVARPRSFLGQFFHRSVTASVLLHSVLPVLVLPATE